MTSKQRIWRPTYGSPVFREFLARTNDRFEHSELVRLWLPRTMRATRLYVDYQNGFEQHVITEFGIKVPPLARTKKNLLLLQSRLFKWLQGIKGVSAWESAYYNPDAGYFEDNQCPNFPWRFIFGYTLNDFSGSLEAAIGSSTRGVNIVTRLTEVRRRIRMRAGASW